MRSMVSRRTFGLLLAALTLFGAVGCHGGRRNSEIAYDWENAQRPGEMKRKITKTVTLDYWLYLPDGFGSQKKWPLMLFLHGSGERGSDLEKVKVNGPSKLIAEGRKYPCIVVSPQCPEHQWWDQDALFALLDDLCERLPVDADRIYLTGLSMGGFATWDMATAHPERFAAAVPICGGGEPDDAARLRNLPIWAFHGADDPVVPVVRTTEMVEAIRAAGGNPRVTIYPGVGHGSWVQAYADDALYEWLFAQHR